LIQINRPLIAASFFQWVLRNRGRDVGVPDSVRLSISVTALHHRTRKMTRTWYVTFEVQQRGVLPKRRNPRVTRLFDTKAEAKNFAREKFNEGLSVYAGTINPHVPKEIIPSRSIPRWLDDAPDAADSGCARSEEK
jgi:hypothetical protein